MSDETKFVTLDCFGAAASQSPSPPPWRVDESNREWWILLGAGGHTIMAIGYRDGGQPPGRANAALIASAPTLRDQLARAVALLRRYVDAEFDEDPIAYEAHTFLDEIDKPG